MSGLESKIKGKLDEINQNCTLQIEELEKKHQQVVNELIEEYEKQQKILQGANLKKGILDEYLDKLEILFNNKKQKLQEELEKRKDIIKQSALEEQKEIITKISSDLGEVIISKGKEEKHFILADIAKKENEINTLENALYTKEKEYQEKIIDINDEYSKRQKELIASLKSEDSKKIKKKYIIIPEDKREKFRQCISEGFLPYNEISDLEITNYKDTKAGLKEESLKIWKAEEEIKIGNKYKEETKEITQSLEEKKEELDKLKIDLENLEDKIQKDLEKINILQEKFGINGQIIS